MPDILMIDDDAEFSDLVSKHFTGLGYIMTLAGNGTEGLAKAKSIKPDIIFLDVMMPDMNGIEVLRELHADDDTSEIPVIVMTAKFFDTSATELFTQERNCKAFLSKPVALSYLQQKAETLLKK
jgi:CheY-like chemotaxis protein